MKIPQRVVWSEGMFMNPQHLQQADLYHESLLSARLGAMTPYDWGVVEMDVDDKALAAGQFQLLRFFGILPDGLGDGRQHRFQRRPQAQGQMVLGFARKAVRRALRQPPAHRLDHAAGAGHPPRPRL